MLSLIENALKEVSKVLSREIVDVCVGLAALLAIAVPDLVCFHSAPATNKMQGDFEEEFAAPVMIDGPAGRGRPNGKGRGRAPGANAKAKVPKTTDALLHHHSLYGEAGGTQNVLRSSRVQLEGPLRSG